MLQIGMPTNNVLSQIKSVLPHSRIYFRVFHKLSLLHFDSAVGTPSLRLGKLAD
jgi:hypothetical protein